MHMVSLRIDQRGRVPVPIVLVFFDVTLDHTQNGSVVLLELSISMELVGRVEHVRDAGQLAHTQEEAGSKLIPVVRQEGPGTPIFENSSHAKRHSCGVSVEVVQRDHSC